MKIAITGAHRTGKTTLARQLEASLSGYQFLAEPYHLLEEAGHLFSEIPTVEDYLIQLEYSINQLWENGGNVIFDRCPMGFLAYLHASDEIDIVDFRELYQRVEVAMTQLDYLVFVPIENPDVIGCEDSELPELRQEVDGFLSKWTRDFGVEVIEVNGDVEQRCRAVMKQLNF